MNLESKAVSRRKGPIGKSSIGVFAVIALIAGAAVALRTLGDDSLPEATATTTPSTVEGSSSSVAGDEALVKGECNPLNTSSVSALLADGDDMKAALNIHPVFEIQSVAVAPSNRWWTIEASIADLGGHVLGSAVWMAKATSTPGSGEPGGATIDPATVFTVGELSKLVSNSSPLKISAEVESSMCPPVLPGEQQNLQYLTGSITGGDEWVIVRSESDGLCLSMSELYYGCDTVGPVIPVGAPQETVRIAAMAHPTDEIEEDNAGVLAFAVAPPGTSDIELVFPSGNDRHVSAGPTQSEKIWAIPIEPGNNPTMVRYIDSDGVLLLQLDIEH